MEQFCCADAACPRRTYPVPPRRGGGSERSGVDTWPNQIFVAGVLDGDTETRMQSPTGRCSCLPRRVTTGRLAVSSGMTSCRPVRYAVVAYRGFHPGAGAAGALRCRRLVDADPFPGPMPAISVVEHRRHKAWGFIPIPTPPVRYTRSPVQNRKWECREQLAGPNTVCRCRLHQFPFTEPGPRNAFDFIGGNHDRPKGVASKALP
jgi:hypothetical protein